MQGALRAHAENTEGKWRLSLLPLHPLEKVPSDIEVGFLKEIRDRFFLLSMPGCKGTDAKGHFCFSTGDWASSLRGIDPNSLKLHR